MIRISSWHQDWKAETTYDACIMAAEYARAAQAGYDSNAYSTTEPTEQMADYVEARMASIEAMRAQIAHRRATDDTENAELDEEQMADMLKDLHIQCQRLQLLVVKTDWQTAHLQSEPVEYLDLRAVADRVGLSHQRVRVLRSAGEMPEPDSRIGHAVGWLPATIDRWQASRKTGGSPAQRG